MNVQKILEFVKKKKKMLIFVGLFVFGLVLLNYLNKATFLPKVVSTQPDADATHVELDSSIKIVFDKSFKSDTQKAKLHIRLKPGTVFTQIWRDDSTLLLTPVQLLVKDTEYIVDVVYNDKEILTFGFKTTKFTEEEISEQTQEQSRRDFEFASETKMFFDENPWQIYMPLEGENFSIMYDYERGAFNIWLNVDSTASDAEKARVRVDSVAALREMLEGIELDLSDFSYYYVYRDE